MDKPVWNEAGGAGRISTLEPMCGTQREFCRHASASTPLLGRVTRSKSQTLEGRKAEGAAGPMKQAGT